MRWRSAVRRRRTLLALAGAWSVGLAAAGLWAPLGSRQVERSTLSVAGQALRTSVSVPSTLLAADGPVALVPVLAPLGAVVAVTALLGLRRRQAKVGAGPFAWSLVAALGLLSLVGVLTVGAAIAPVALLLAGACASPQAGALARERWDGGRWG